MILGTLHIWFVIMLEVNTAIILFTRQEEPLRPAKLERIKSIRTYVHQENKSAFSLMLAITADPTEDPEDVITFKITIVLLKCK